MKTAIKCISAIVMLTVCVTVFGQQATKFTPEEKAKRESLGLKKQFSLTDAQTAQCEQIIKKYTAKLSETKQIKGDSIKQGNARQQLVKQRNDEIKAVLTPEQSARFDKWMQDRHTPKGKAMAGEDKLKK